VSAPQIPYSLPDLPQAERLARAQSLLAELRTRRSCRNFSHRDIPRDLLEACVAVANTAPSGANRQPWRFVLVSDPDIKREIRQAAESEERENYDWRMPPEWLEALEPIGTDASKPFLEIAPWLVVIFRVDWELVRGQKYKNYYPIESVGLAAGLFLTACHHAGLATLTHTPSPMNFLRDILKRGKNEKPFLLIPVGYPAGDCRVPDLPKKSADDVIQWNR
jgi:nitroreductase